MRARAMYLVAAALLTPLLAPQSATSCGEAPWQPPGFVWLNGPEDLETFAAGDLGIVLPTYARSYLIVAYRAMIGRPLTEEEQKGAMRVWNVRLGRERWTDRVGLNAWLDARRSVCGPEGSPGSNKARMLEAQETGELRYYAWGNCYPDAFETAAARLDELVAQHGASAAETMGWLSAQDAVFRNCSRQGLVLPPTSGADGAEQRADRDYQLAAAWFYATDFEMAQAAFRAIARDPASRWHLLAPYLVVRCLVRQADFDWQNRVPYLSQALIEIDTFLQDKTAAPLFPAARRLRGIILKRLDPERRAPELADLIIEGGYPGDFAQNLWDVTTLLDRYFYSPGRQWTDAVIRPDLILWLRSFQGWWTRKPGESPLDKWHQNRSAPWLAAALAHARGQNEAANELIEAADTFDGHSPAWPTIEYNRLRLLVEQSRLGEARRGLTAALGDKRFGTSTTSGNLLRALRARVAGNRADFLEYAVRTPACNCSSQYSEMGRLVAENAARLADTGIVETLVPLSDQRAMIDEPGLDDATRERLAAAVWVRALLLRRLDIARQVTPVVERIVSRLRSPHGEKDALRAFLATQSEAKAYREATFVLLHLPGMVPFLEPRLRAADDLGHRWPYNWWDGPGDSWESSWDTMNGRWRPAVPAPADGAYPPEALRKRAAAERAQLAALGSPLTFMGAEILRWAAQLPDEPRIPDMLHDLIIAGRYTGGDEDSDKLLERAFRLLHRRYKDTPAAAATPYWYKSF